MKRMAQRVGGRGASRRYDVAHPSEPEPHGDFTRQRADRRCRNRVDAALLLVPAVVQPVLLFGKLLRSAARADDHSDSPQLLARHRTRLDPRVRYRLARSRDRQRDCARYMLPLLRFHPGGFIEVRDLAGNLHLVVRRVEARDAPHPALPAPRRVPKNLPADAVRAHRAHPRHHYATLGHRFIFSQHTLSTYDILGCFPEAFMESLRNTPLLFAIAATTAGLAQAQVPPDIAKELITIGRSVCVPETAQLYRPLQPNPPYAGVTFTRDISFGPDPKDVLDVAEPERGGGKRPVLIYVSGGAGNKLQGGPNGDVFYDNVMVWATKNGMVGVNMQRRPGTAWDDPGKAVGMVVQWVSQNIASHKGNPARVFIWTQSAGNVPVSTYVGHSALWGPKGVGSKG